MKSFGLQRRQYVDNIQLCLALSSDPMGSVEVLIEVMGWMRLQLNRHGIGTVGGMSDSSYL